jgi:hypothetical protein
MENNEVTQLIEELESLQCIIRENSAKRRAIYKELEKFMPCEVGDRIIINGNVRGTCESIKQVLPSKGRMRVLMTISRKFAGGLVLKELHRAFADQVTIERKGGAEA